MLVKLSKDKASSTKNYSYYVNTATFSNSFAPVNIISRFAKKLKHPWSPRLVNSGIPNQYSGIYNCLQSIHLVLPKFDIVLNQSQPRQVLRSFCANRKLESTHGCNSFALFP